MTVDSEYCVFTVCNVAYLPKALALAESLRRYTGQQLNVVLFDRKQSFRHPEGEANIIWLEDLGVEHWEQLAFLYDIIEFSTSLKPFIARTLLRSHRKVVFLDPDTCLFAPLSSVLAELDEHPILLTPHYTTPQPSTAHESDLAMMRFGSFNLGFFALRRTPEAEAFLDWWHRRCIDFCFMESQFGLSTDQKWISIAPCFFPSLRVSFHLGYNMAPWNTFERRLERALDGSGYIVNGRFPLVFFHFSNFDASDPQYLNKRASSEQGVQYPLLLEISQEYAQALERKTALVERIKYSFDYMSDGNYISPTLRRAYAALRAELPPDHAPFDANGPVGALARRNGLVGPKIVPYKYPTMRQVAGHSRKLAMIHRGLRMLLRALGPNRFYDLTKLFVYVSSLRMQRGMWKH
jgi:hypothetical protein